ncbi:hypothetical protein ACWEQM_23690 [Streptomyces nodosus]
MIDFSVSRGTVRCRRLGVLPEFAPLDIRRSAHMLGYGGQFSTEPRPGRVRFGGRRGTRGD